MTPKFSIGDKVRITPNFFLFFQKVTCLSGLKRCFVVSKVVLTIPIKYKMTDYNEEIQCSFYEQELQRTAQDIFKFEKYIH